MVIYLESDDCMSVETFLIENRINYTSYHDFFKGYFYTICEGALELLVKINPSLRNLDEEIKNNIINKIAKKLDADENDLYYTLFKAQDLIEKELLLINIREENTNDDCGRDENTTSCPKGKLKRIK